MTSVWQEWMQKACGQESIASATGLITYVIDGSICRLVDLYVSEYHRDNHEWKRLYKRLLEICKDKEITELQTFINCSKPKAMQFLAAYSREGFIIIGADNNIIVLSKRI